MSRRARGVEHHVVVDIDLRVFGGSALTDDIDVPKGRGCRAPATGIPVTYVPARNTIFLSLRARLGRGARGDRHLHRRQRARLQRLPRLPPRVHRRLRADGQPRHQGRASRAPAPLQIHTPLIDLTKAEIIRRGRRARRRLRASRTAATTPTRRAAPAASCDSCLLRRKGFAEAGVADPDPLPGALEPAHDLHRQGDLLHAPGRGNARRPAGGLLPLHRLQPLDRTRGRTEPARSASSATPTSSGPTGRAAASSGPPTSSPTRSPRSWPAGDRPAHRFVVCTGGEPLLQLDAALIAALHDGASRSRSRPTARGPSRRHRLGLRQPEGAGPTSSCAEATS